MDEWIVRKADLPEGVVEFEELLCGCGRPYHCWEALHSYLKIKTSKEFYTNTDDPYYLFFMYVLSSLKLTEHGTSIYGAWITDKGRKVLKWLDENVEKAGDLVIDYYNEHTTEEK